MTDQTIETRTFHVGDILSVTHGCLVSPSHMDGIYRILNWLTNDELFTHQLPRASREAEPFLRELFPDLSAVAIPEFTQTGDVEAIEAEVFGWLDAVVDEYGETREVPRLPRDDHTHIDPISELKMVRPDLPIIAVVDGRPERGPQS